VRKFKKEDRYLVLKRKDIAHSLSELEQHLLMCISAKIHKDHPRHCVVVEHDWPEYEPTWKAIENRMNGKPPETGHRGRSNAAAVGDCVPDGANAPTAAME
jgi:hypothetical protein